MPFIPISDDNDLRLIGFQIVTAVLIAANVIVFLWQLTLDDESLWSFWYSYGLIPAVLTGGRELMPSLEKVPAWATVFTSMFLHSSYWHVGGNMLFLWVFGDNIEDATGHVRFIFFFLLCGIVAGLSEVIVAPSSTVPVVGASGAIAGILGGYLVLHPRRRLLILVMRTVPIRLNVGLVLVFWILFQIGAALVVGGDEDNDTAWWAHVGGFLAGMVLIPLFKRRDVPLFDGQPLAFAMFYRRHDAVDTQDEKDDRS